MLIPLNYRKKPVIIQAIQWTGDNKKEISEFVGIYFKDKESVIIPTLEGDLTAQIGDFIIKGVKGEFYPCKPDIFEATYEIV